MLQPINQTANQSLFISFYHVQMIHKMDGWWIQCIRHPMYHRQTVEKRDVWWFGCLDVGMFVGMNLSNLA